MVGGGLVRGGGGDLIIIVSTENLRTHTNLYNIWMVVVDKLVSLVDVLIRPV